MNIPSYWERDLRDLKAWWRRATPDSIFRGLFAVIGGLVGGLGGIVTFLVVYLAAIDSVGWVIGIALGWIPAFLAAAVVYFVGRYLWWALPFLIGYVRHAFF
jgi:hypothetical protein